MIQVTRRQLLAAAGTVAATGGIAAVIQGLNQGGGPGGLPADPLGLGQLGELGEAVLPEAIKGPSKPQVLVVVTLAGGNDGLNTVVPYADGAYHDARPELAYKPEDVIKLDDQFGLNPSMTGFEQLWKSKNLAIVHGVGYPQPDRSHFRSMDIWHTATPDGPSPSGWLGRWLDHSPDDPLRALNVGNGLPLLALGEKRASASLVRESWMGKPVYQPFMANITSAAEGDSPSMAAVRESLAATKNVALQLEGPYKTIDERRKAENQMRKEAKERGEELPPKAGGHLGKQLEQVAEFIIAGLPTQAYICEVGGFDTHASERGTHERLLKDVDEAVTALMERTANAPVSPVVMVYSEFGRRVRANASQGTDHGTAAPVFLIGETVRGGYYGEPPSLTDLDRGDLKYHIDFRDVYGELVSGVLGADPTPVVGANRSTVGFLPRA